MSKELTRKGLMRSIMHDAIVFEYLHNGLSGTENTKNSESGRTTDLL